MDSSKKSIEKEKGKDRKLNTLLSKRKDTAHDDYEEEDINDVVNENDDDNDDEDDDENVEDSLAYSKYVRARMNESEKACKLPNLGGEKQFTKIPTMALKQGTYGRTHCFIEAKGTIFFYLEITFKSPHTIPII